MADTVEALKAAGGPDMKALSRKAGFSPGYIHSILKQGRTPSVEAFLEIAKAANVEPGWLLFGDERFQLNFPVLGEMTERDTWDRGKQPQTVAFEPGPNAYDMIAIRVEGDANAPAYRNGDVLYCNRHSGPNLHNVVVGRDCAVRTRDGQGYIMHVLGGSRPGTFTLRSISNPVAKGVENVVLAWAAPIEWIKRGR